MTQTRHPDECQTWTERLRGYLVDPHRGADIDGLPEHVAGCPSCQREIGGLIRTDDCLRQAVRFLEPGTPSPPAERLDQILAAARDMPETARMLRRVRRPVNTMLWIAVLFLSLTGLAGLAWCVYWWLSTR